MPIQPLGLEYYIPKKGKFLFTGVASAITRFYAELDSVQQSHGVYANTLVFQAGDTYKFDFLAPTSTVSADEYLVDGDGSSDRAYVAMQAGGTFLVNPNEIANLNIDGLDVALNSSYPTDSKLHTVILTLSVGARIGTLGARFSLANFYNGIIANPVATISGVTTSNTLGLATGDVEYPAENTFGAEEIVNTAFVNTNGWIPTRDVSTITAVDNKLLATADSTVTFGQVTEMTGLTIGNIYAVKAQATCDDPTSTVRFRVAHDSILDSFDVELGLAAVSLSIDTVFTATATTMWFGTVITGQDGGSVSELSLASIKEVQGNAITYVNIPDAQREQYTLIDGSWIGSHNFWVYGDAINYSVVGASARIIGVNSSSGVVSGNRYVVTGNLLNDNAAYMDIANASGRIFFGDNTGKFQKESLGTEGLAGTSLRLMTNSAGFNTGSALDISVKRKIEIA